MKLEYTRPIGYVTDPNIRKYCSRRGIQSAEVDIDRYLVLDGGQPTTLCKVRKSDLVGSTIVEEERILGVDNRLRARLVGHGKHHHLTYGILMNRVYPKHLFFSVASFDNHPDMGHDGETYGDTIDCNNHLFHAVHDASLLNVVHIGKNSERGFFVVDGRRSLEETTSKLLSHIKKEFKGEPVRDDDMCFSFQTRELVEKIKGVRGSAERVGVFDPETGRELLASLDDLVYVTIDVDVLSPREVSASYGSAWDQGQMRLPELYHLLESIFRSKHVIGVDVCGMTDDPRSFDVYDRILEKVDEFEGKNGRVQIAEVAGYRLSVRNAVGLLKTISMDF